MCSLCSGALPAGPGAVLLGRVSPDRLAPAHPGVQHQAARPRPPRLTTCPAGGEGGRGGAGGGGGGEHERPPHAPGSRRTRAPAVEPEPQQPWQSDHWITTREFKPGRIKRDDQPTPPPVSRDITSPDLSDLKDTPPTSFPLFSNGLSKANQNKRPVKLISEEGSARWFLIKNEFSRLISESPHWSRPIRFGLWSRHPIVVPNSRY